VISCRKRGKRRKETEKNSAVSAISARLKRPKAYRRQAKNIIQREIINQLNTKHYDDYNRYYRHYPDNDRNGEWLGQLLPRPPQAPPGGAKYEARQPPKGYELE
jgi:hypothetical protein